MKHTLLLAFILFVVASCHSNSGDNNDENAVASPTSLGYSVIHMYPHDTTSFTEGLEWHDSSLYESTGNYGSSKLSRVDLKTGKDIQKVDLSKEYFGEGITVLNGKLFQLTWQEHKCFIYDPKTFKKTGEYDYEGQGWGMTNDGKNIIMDSGSNMLLFRDPATFKIIKTLTVIGVPPVPSNGTTRIETAYINELEYVDGFIYANVWETNYILKIDPSNGRIVAKADLSNIIGTNVPGGLSDNLVQKGAVLNGIAYDPIGKRFFITGKLWPTIFEIKFN